MHIFLRKKRFTLGTQTQNMTIARERWQISARQHQEIDVSADARPAKHHKSRRQHIAKYGPEQGKAKNTKGNSGFTHGSHLFRYRLRHGGGAELRSPRWRFHPTHAPLPRSLQRSVRSADRPWPRRAGPADRLCCTNRGLRALPLSPDGPILQAL